MPQDHLPPPLIHTVVEVLSSHHNSHTKISTLLDETSEVICIDLQQRSEYLEQH